MNTCCPTIIVDNFCAVKDPDEVLDYTIDWSSILDASDPADTIVASTWIVEQYPNGAALSIDSESEATPFTTVWLSAGGILNTIHKVTNHVTTAGGRQYERTIKIWIQNKSGLGGSGSNAMTIGIPGEDGVDGLNGNPGVQGEKGDKGDKGDPGIDGVDGSDGSDGSDGTSVLALTSGVETLGLSGAVVSGVINRTTIGKHVFITGRLTVSSGTSSSSATHITGFLYAATNPTGFTTASYGINLGSDISSERTMIARMGAGQNSLSLHKWGSTGQEAPMQQDKFTSGDYIDLNFSYYSEDVPE